MNTSVLESIPETIQELVRAQVRVASDLLDMFGRPLLRQTKRMAPQSCCHVPPPCWVPVQLCDVVSLVKCGGTATLAVRVRNCGAETHRVRVIAEPVDAAAPATTPPVKIDPAAIVLRPLQHATITATVTVPDSSRDDTICFNLFIVGCRRYYVTWSIKSGSALRSSRHELELDDCPDYRHHWYDHFYCERPCHGRVLRDPAADLAEVVAAHKATGPNKRTRVMADVANLLKRMQEVQLRYYQTLGRAAVDYWRSMFEAFGMATTSTPVASSPHPHGVAARPSPPPAMISLVLEAAAGEKAESAFVVDNKLPQAVSATVAVSEFVAPDGRPVRVATTVSPPTVSLEPGGQQVVKITVAVTDELAHGVAYRAYARVPGLSDGQIALVLRRRAVPDAGSAAP